ncbi:MULTISPECIES: lipase [Myxococcaceae]|uniref:lipase n=1 Tax=Myxococcaceae TaxID=31 RepID=UPI00188EECC2|nr:MULTISPECIES: lipase [Myxococcaceae]MBF5045156.1 lipase [Simulacricoccus sp. 17bor-14]
MPPRLTEAPVPETSLSVPAPRNVLRPEAVLDGADGWWGPGCAGLAGWFRAKSAPTTDVTAEFRRVHARVRAAESVLPAEAREHQYLLLRGLLGDELPGYFEDNVGRLVRRGLDVREVAVDTEGALSANVLRVCEALRDAVYFGRSVVLVGHSKGAVEAMAALALHPELRGPVRALVALQAPYGGSPIANDLITIPRLRRLVDTVMPCVFQGQSVSVEDFTYAERMRFVRAHPYPTEIPTVALATSRGSPLSLLAPVARYTRRRYGWASDGFVVPEDALVPGARVVRLDDVDHAQGAMRSLPGLSRWSPGDLTEALVALALTR